MFESTVYSGRRNALVSALADHGIRAGRVVFLGNRESPMNYTDNAYRFRQDSTFLYYVGIAEPDLAASLDLATGRATLYADELTLDDMVWTGPRPSSADYGKLCDADDVRPRAAIASAFGIGSGGAVSLSVLFTPPYRGEATIELASLLGVAPGAVSAMASLPLIRAIVAQREIKEAREVARIEKAVDVSIDMHKAVMAAARPGATEAAMMAEAYRVAYAGGGQPSFSAIATTRGSILHNHGYCGTLSDGGLFLLDAGAETDDGYAGDLTSSFPIGKRYSDRQKAIYDIVLKAGTAGSSLLKPGLAFKGAHLAAARAIAEGLSALGIMKGDIDEAVAAGAHACFFPHGLGHQMGLDVHDMENFGEVWVGYDGEPKSAQFGLKSLRMAKALKPGMVMTIEPGLYFIPGLIAAWKAERRHEAFIDYAAAEAYVGVGGVRNEEDWLVTETGARLLGKSFDKSISAMESYRA